MSKQRPCDFPTGTGYWCFRGRDWTVDYHREMVQAVYDVAEYTDCLDPDEANYPAIRLRGERAWEGKRYPDPPEGVGGQRWIGEWWPLAWPWEAGEP